MIIDIFGGTNDCFGIRTTDRFDRSSYSFIPHCEGRHRQTWLARLGEALVTVSNEPETRPHEYSHASIAPRGRF